MKMREAGGWGKDAEGEVRVEQSWRDECNTKEGVK